MFVSKIREDDLTLELIDKLLFQGLEDSGESVDCIIVLGSIKASKYRVPIAVEAYQSGRANKLLLCGGALRDFPDGRFTESEYMLKTALASGVPDENIVLENTSQNTVENIRCALVELQKYFSLNKIRSVLLVTTTFHMRRSIAIARHLFPDHIAVIPCPANDNHTRRDNWMNSPAGIDRAKSEAMNIVRYIIDGIIPDFEI